MGKKMILHLVVLLTFIQCTEGQINGGLNITGIRLVNGSGLYDGRVELNVNGIWGTICSKSFDLNDTDVLCRMLNLSATWYDGNARYGQGNGPIFATNLGCYGNETHVNQCRYDLSTNCTHSNDVSILCTRCGRIKTVNILTLTISSTGTDLTPHCKDNFFINKSSYSSCNTSELWNPASLICKPITPITDIRLTDGVGLFDGRVEIQMHGTWGDICFDSFSHGDARAICNMLYNSTWYGYHFYEGYNFDLNTYVHINELDCDGDETDIQDCNFEVQTSCSIYHRVYVGCDIYPLNITDIRLVNGTGPYDGRVELKYKDQWGTICDYNWMDEDTGNTLCRMLNLSFTAYSSTAKFGQGIGPILFGRLNCSSDADHINDCHHYESWHLWYCDHNRDASLICTDCGLPNISNGVITSSNGSMMTVTCNMGYVPVTYNMECLNNGTWLHHETCQVSECGPPNIIWHSDFYSYDGTTVILDCMYYQSYAGNVRLTCNNVTKYWIIEGGCQEFKFPLEITGIRLVSGIAASYGHVEIQTMERWGTICDVGFGINEANTICRMLGQWPAVTYYTDGRNGDDRNPIFVVDLVCEEDAVHINNCTYNTLTYQSCSHFNDISVVCLDCGDPTPFNGFINSTQTSYGSVVEIDCEIGYRLEGNKTIVCELNGSWNDSPYCQYIDCGPFDSPVNGYYTSDNSTTFNSTVVFGCNENYLLIGENIMHCKSDGKWSSEIPSCVRKNGIGGVCSTNDNCTTPDAVCKKSHCVCVTGIYDSRTENCDTMPLYPYGPTEGDKIHDDWERCAKGVNFDLGLPLCGTSYSRIFVCAHGTVSFGRRYNTPTPPKNLTMVEKLKRDILAPFYAHFNASVGKVYYRSHNVLDSYVALRKRDETKDIESKIRQFDDVPSSFEASFTLIVTWENVIPDDVDFDLTKSGGSTFQLVLVSNGEMTYSFYIYSNGMMKWISKRPKYAPVWVGYYCKTDTPFTFHNSFTPSILELDNNAVHRGVSGVVFKPLVRAENSTKNNNVSCVTWYQENKHEKQQLDFINSLLPQCPCDISLARWDPWFWHIESRKRYNGELFICVDMLPSRIYQPYSKSCCYNYTTSLWIDERPIAGGFYRYHPENTVDHYKHDILPKQMCCSPLTPYCKYYYELRPAGTCYRESPYNFGSFWGDPHFRTLDGLSYTFNGLGEYTLLQIKTGNKTFNLQARTQRAVKSDGTLSGATIFSAFSAKDETDASFHVELNRAKNGFNIYGNGKDLTKQYNETADEDVPIFDAPHGTLVISKRGQTLVALFPSSGISLNVSINVGMLSLNSIVPKTFANVTTGLLGNYNEVMEDDFTLPNRTVLSANITEREIFNYGQNWEIDGEVSAFVYPEGKNHSDYHNATFIPRFLDEAAPEKIKEAESVCNGSKNSECVFDYVFTENEEIASSTNQLTWNTNLTISQMDEVVPQIIGCESITATYENIVSCPITIDEGTNVEFLRNNVNASFERESSSITYYQADNKPVDVRAVSINKQGRSSPVFRMNILLCTGCSGNGACTDIPRVDHSNTDAFQYATCECDINYEGPDCETLFDGCSEEPCSLNRDCHQLVGKNRTVWQKPYLCDACPDGYLAVDTYNDTCEDIDECTMDNPPCDQECTNFDGSHECSCRFGYRPDPRNKEKCLDINECEDLNTHHDCSQNCTNTDGSFVCSCYNGYTFDSDSGSCIKDSETVDDPCSTINCSHTIGGCRITDENTAVCFCNRGYELYSNNSCIDINECDRNICSQKCDNTVGGFECSCFTGYTLMGKTTCQECEVGFWGENCENKCMCKGEGVKTCDHVKGCLCKDGWKGETCQEDINECNETSNACNDPKKECFNSLGSFSCQCLEGFEGNTDGICEDIDECNLPTLNGCDQICKNTIGSYFCECELGFTESESSCQNINECEIRTHGCEQICDDNPGAYNCFCYFGFALNDDRRTCTKLSDPCSALYDLRCSHYCYKGENSAECRCIDGFALSSDNQTCIDIDECTDGTHGCDLHAECKNTNGSYMCDCSIGFKMQNDGRTCTECDDFHYGEDCAMSCACLYGVCNNTFGCDCNNGWQGNNCDVDINECTTEQVVCNPANEQCVNTLGSAECHCILGYERDESNDCVDTDECADSRLNACDQTCINIPGNYLCECQTGFLFNDGSCQDIDECENKKSNCEQMCENTVGSYNCLCEDGFRLNLTDRKSCIASDDCLNPRECGDHSVCYHYNGKDICKCFKGFQNNSGMCEDINECNILPKLCSHKCSNFDGSYVCSCETGYYLRNDLTTCTECEAGTYGDECKQICTCINDNTEFCDPVTGDCICKPGWEGLQCNEDKNECQDTSVCPQNSICQNTDGSYHCDCDIGYFKMPSGLCSVCDNRHYGKHCLKECTCVLTRTNSCNHINGNCVCMEGWTGDTCSDDVNECDQIVDVCREKSNTVCSNTVGSYKCTCMEGFREIGDICEAVDECTRLVNTGECASKDCVIENGDAVCKTKAVGLTLPMIIGISGGSLLALIIIVLLIVVCMRRIRKKRTFHYNFRNSRLWKILRRPDPNNRKGSNEK